MAGTKRSERELRWREVLKHQADSGLSIRKFCASEGISEPSFYAWRKKLRDPQDDLVRPPKLRRHKEASDSGRLFVPLQLLDATQTLEIIHPLGYRIQVVGDVNPVALRQVIETLDARGTR